MMQEFSRHDPFTLHATMLELKESSHDEDIGPPLAEVEVLGTGEPILCHNPSLGEIATRTVSTIRVERLSDDQETASPGLRIFPANCLLKTHSHQSHMIEHSCEIP